MNRNSIVAIAVGVILLGAGVFIATNNSDTTTSSEEQSDANSNSESRNNGDNPLGLQLDDLSGPYRLTLTTGGVSGSDASSVIETDADGNSKTTVISDGQEASIIYIDGVTYTQNPDDGSWIKFSESQGGFGGPDQNGALSQADLEGLYDAEVVDLGTGPCSTGTCRIYEIDNLAGERGTVKVDDATNRLSELEVMTIDGEKSTIVYEYDVVVSIEAPENATEFEIPDIDG